MKKTDLVVETVRQVSWWLIAGLTLILILSQLNIASLKRTNADQREWLSGCQTNYVELLRQYQEQLKLPTIEPESPSHCVCNAADGGRCVLRVHGGRLIQNEGDSYACW